LLYATYFINFANSWLKKAAAQDNKTAISIIETVKAGAAEGDSDYIKTRR